MTTTEKRETRGLFSRKKIEENKEKKDRKLEKFQKETRDFFFEIEVIGIGD